MTTRDLIALLSKYHVKNELEKYYVYFYVDNIDCHCSNTDFNLKLVKIKNNGNLSNVLYSIYRNEYNNGSIDFLQLIIDKIEDNNIKNAIFKQYGEDKPLSDENTLTIINNYLDRYQIIKIMENLLFNNYIRIKKLI